MGFHYPFFTFSDWLWSAACFLALALVIIILVGCLGCRRKKDQCGDCGLTDCGCSEEGSEGGVRSTVKRRFRNRKEI